MLLSGDRAAMTRQLSDVLAGYEDFHDFDRRELHLIEALRTLRLIHYAAWIARRWADPAFPAAFPWFNTARYWQDRILELRGTDRGHGRGAFDGLNIPRGYAAGKAAAARPYRRNPSHAMAANAAPA